MEFLKNLNIKYSGQLHDVRLINFSVDKAEVQGFLPKPLKLLDYNGRALISMVNVMLKDMKMDVAPMKFSYRHVAFRLLLDDSEYDGSTHGIYFLKSFTDQALMVFGGNIITDFNLELASITDEGNCFDLKQKEKFLHYAISHRPPQDPNTEMKKVVGAVDRAYSAKNERVKMLQITREEWPIEWIDCYHFQTNFFETARLEGAFRISKVIDYEWLPVIEL